MEQFGRYQLLHQLAVGGMGEIFLARSSSISGFSKNLVIKRIRPEMTSNVRLISMFLNEAQVSISLSHQNVIQVFDFGQCEETYFLAMEHVHGCDLVQLLNLDSVLGRGLSPGLALYIMSEVCRGLDYAHTSIGPNGQPLNLIHRDMSPDNIMLSKDGGVKIADFGISNFADKLLEKKSKKLEGKIPYMAPEQARGEPTDARSDVFACGLVLWELLTGEQAHPGEIDRDMLKRVQNGQIQKPSRHNRKVTRRLDRVVMTAIHPDPQKRFQTAREFGDALRSLLTKKYDNCGSHELRLYLTDNKAELGILDLSAVCPANEAVSVSPAFFQTSDELASFEYPDQAKLIARNFCKSPDLNRLVELAAFMEKSGDLPAARATYRIAVLKFAQQGMFAQALSLAIKAHQLMPEDETFIEDMALLPSYIGYSNQRLIPHFFMDSTGFSELLSYIVVASLSQNVTSIAPCPWLSSLSPSAFAQLIRLSKVQQYSITDLIIRQGETGDSMFLIVKGRTLIHTLSSSGEKIFLASLAEGEYFGEQGFFGTSVRNATVEAMESVEVIEFDRTLMRNVIQTNPQAESTLIDLYKARVVDGLLARSEVFSVLSAESRKNLLPQLDNLTVPKGEAFINQGELSREAYIIKSGHAEIFKQQEGQEVRVAELGPGTIIGEVAALAKIPRTASVRAIESMELFRITEEMMDRMKESSPQLIEKIDMLAGNRQQSISQISVDE